MLTLEDRSTEPEALRAAAAEARSFRDTLSRFATGVVLITAETSAGPVGMAVNSFASVSLEPPMISFCPMRSSATWAAIRETGHFAVSILRSHHEVVSRRFAQRGADRFESFRWLRSPAGDPVLDDALGWIDATVLHVHDAGDHELVVASADAWSTVGAGRPLVFFGGAYGGLAA